MEVRSVAEAVQLPNKILNNIYGREKLGTAMDQSNSICLHSIFGIFTVRERDNFATLITKPVLLLHKLDLSPSHGHANQKNRRLDNSQPFKTNPLSRVAFR